MPRGSSPTAAVHARARDRESLAFELRKGGASLSEIVEKLYRHENPDGVSGKRLTFQAVSKMLKRVMENLEAVSKEDAETLRRLDLERLDRMLLGLWAKAKSGHEGAVDRVLRILERRSKLLGLDAPTKIAVKHDPKEMTDSELRSAALDIVAKYKRSKQTSEQQPSADVAKPTLQ